MVNIEFIIQNVFVFPSILSTLKTDRHVITLSCGNLYNLYKMGRYYHCAFWNASLFTAVDLIQSIDL